MADGKKSKISQFFSGLKAEFTKIIWPEPETVGRQSAAVIAVSIVIGLLIVILDYIIQHGVDILVNL